MRNSVIKKNRKVYIFKRQQTSSGGGGGADLENNKQVSITENGTVEITPSAGKDGMKKVTATVNIPSGGSATAYAWVDNDNNVYYFNFDIAPQSFEDYIHSKTLDSGVEAYSVGEVGNVRGSSSFERTSDTQFVETVEDRMTLTYTFTRDATKDFTLWQLSE